MKKIVAFTLISFVLLTLRYHLFLELEANWLDQNVNKIEFELSRM